MINETHWKTLVDRENGWKMRIKTQIKKRSMGVEYTAIVYSSACSINFHDKKVYQLNGAGWARKAN